MKKHFLAGTLACAFTAGLMTPSFAQTSGAGGESGTGSSASHSTNGTAGAPSGTAGSKKKGLGLGASKNTSEDRVPHN